MQNIENNVKSVGFIRKVHQGMLHFGKKYQNTIVKDKYTSAKIRHFNRRFIRDYLHSFQWDYGNQTFTQNPDQFNIPHLSYMCYTDTPTIDQLQWLAGFTEHFSTFKMQYTPKYNSKGQLLRYYPIPRLFYVGSCLPLLQYIANWYKVPIHKYTRGHWGLVLSSTLCLQLISDILPYTWIKKHYYRAIRDYISIYNLDKSQFTDKGSFEQFVIDHDYNKCPLFNYREFMANSSIDNYIGGMYDAKGNVDFYLYERSMHHMQLHSQHNYLLTEISQYLREFLHIPCKLKYSYRDNVHTIHIDNKDKVIVWLNYIVKYCVFKRSYSELLLIWLPIFTLNPKPYIKFDYVPRSIKNYWLFLQYGIELDKSKSIWAI